MEPRYQQEFAVMGESAATGKVHVLRRGFPSAEAAEDHPVRMKDFRRVWVQPIDPKPEPVTSPPPLPFSIIWSNNGHAYLTDAEGRKIASLLGTQARREHTAEIILDRCNGGAA